jgi:hypothetical protein
MTEQHIVRVSFRKQLSDGNYGTEAAEVTLEDVVEGDGDGDALAEVLLLQARRLVHAELGRSPSANVRRAIGAKRPVPADVPVLDEGPEPEWPS